MSVSRRELLKAVGVAPIMLGSTEEHSPAFELDEATISSLQESMKNGKYTSRALIELYLHRIEDLNRRGPELRALIEVNPEALSIAESLDAERKGRGPRGPLHGIPVLIKDNIDTTDRMATTAGSMALVGARPAREAFIVKQLRKAGAVIIGKTNLSEWANFRSTHSSSGWSGRGGQTRNPYALDRTPSGSSSGTGAGIAANLACVGVGTETDGSITSPSAANSLVGLKPTLGLLSQSGIIPIAHSQDTAGPMARTVRDAAILLGVLAGPDARDPVTRGHTGKVHHDYTQYLNAAGLKGARIGIAREKFFGYSRETDKVAEAAISLLRELGAVLIDPANLPNAGKYDDTELEVLLYEFKADLNQYLASLTSGAPARTMKDLIAFNDRNKEREMPFFGQELMQMSIKKGPLATAAYKKALEKNRLLTRSRGIDAVMDKHKLDALVCPTQGPPWLIDLVNGDAGSGSATQPAAVAGYPHITVPMGYVHGLPVGLSFFGRAFSEPTLLKLAYAYEQATHVRKPPAFLKTANIQPLPER